MQRRRVSSVTNGRTDVRTDRQTAGNSMYCPNIASRGEKETVAYTFSTLI